MLVTDLPVETLDHIAAALDSPINLANLGAVCTQLRLLDRRAISHPVLRHPCPTYLASWEKLATNRSLAQNIRILEVHTIRRDPRAL